MTIPRMSTDLSPRLAIALGLIAVIPALLYAVGRSLDGGLMSILNILIIIGVLILLTRPVSVSPHDDLA